MLEQVFTGQCWSGCSLGSVGAGVHWAVLEQVFTGQCWSRCFSSDRAGVQWAELEQVFTGQCWSMCLLVTWAVLE